jgi:hypothetical protein
MFRRLNWVSEHIFENGSSSVLGVYTSIPDLVRYGLRFPESGRLRLTLTKLDSAGEPFGTWTTNNFENIGNDLQPFVKTEEFTAEQVKNLADALARATAVA